MAVPGASMQVAIIGTVATAPASGAGTTIVGPAAFTSTTSNAAPVTTPAASATLATITLPAQAGTYGIEVEAVVGGTTGAIDIGNISVAVSGGPTLRVANGVGSPAVVTLQVVAAGSNTVTATAVATGTTGAVYSVSLIATRLA